MAELSNIFTRGTQALQRERLLQKPCNEDYSFVGKIKSLAPIITKVWDIEETKDFSVSMIHQDGSAVSSSEIEENSCLPVYRNVSDSFVSIFPNSIEFTGISAFLYSSGGEYQKEDFSGSLFCGLLGKTWKKTNLVLISSYKVMQYSQAAFFIVSTLETEIFIDDSLDLAVSRIAISSCAGGELGKIYSAMLLPAKKNVSGIETDVFVVVNQGVLSAGVLCCEEEEPEPPDPPEPPLDCHDAYVVTQGGYTWLLDHWDWGWPSPFYCHMGTHWAGYHLFLYNPGPVYLEMLPDTEPIESRSGFRYIEMTYITKSNWTKKTSSPISDEEYEIEFFRQFPSGEGPKVFILVGTCLRYYVSYFLLIYGQTSSTYDPTNENLIWNGSYSLEWMRPKNIYYDPEDPTYDYITTEMGKIIDMVGNTLNVSGAACYQKIGNRYHYRC